MKKLIVLILLAILLTSCMTLVPERVKVDYAKDWAAENGYIPASDCPDVCEDLPERQSLPKPIIPIFETTDSDGDPIPITQRYLMTMVIQLFGTVEKFQYLVEIYEREYLNTDGRIMPNLTLDELKELYQERLSTIEKVRTELQPEETSSQSNPYLTDSTSLGDQLTVEQFEQLLEVWNQLMNSEEEK